ncbi:MAG: hypothetical protein EP329_18595 [Deltaproteobacteria bacterium]|nr:MAG: hypothetical protein EP329_18595 [Deltaproteobacteria bacterium]
MQVADLKHAFKTLRRSAERLAGAASWRFEPERLSIEWAGVTVSLPVAGDATTCVRMSNKTMRGVARLDLPTTPEHEFRVEDGRFYWEGSYSFSVEQRDDDVPQLLPVNARPLDIALLPIRHGASQIEDAGLADRVADAMERKARSVDTAAAALKWLGVTEEHVAAWVEAHLAAVATGKTTFSLEPRRVVLGRGQFDLFQD